LDHLNQCTIAQVADIQVAWSIEEHIEAWVNQSGSFPCHAFAPCRVKVQSLRNRSVAHYAAASKAGVIQLQLGCTLLQRPLSVQRTKQNRGRASGLTCALSKHRNDRTAMNPAYDISVKLKHWTERQGSIVFLVEISTVQELISACLACLVAHGRVHDIPGHCCIIETRSLDQHK
jgi:hypothetical protein